MELVKLGKKGQLSIPKNVLKRLGIEGEALLMLEITPDGAIRLRQFDVYPLEIYDEERLKEFQEADRMSLKETARLKSSH